MPEAYELGLAAAAAAIREERLSAETLLESLLARISKIEPLLHAWVNLDAEGARAEARACDSEQQSGRLRGPLHGVPVGIKDIYDVAGLATEAGSPLRAGLLPMRDAVTVARLRHAGAIVLGKTETTQFAYADPAPTRNPWNLAHTPGGSSSGSAAAVAARMVPAALGTQTAGSILRPAAFCGVVGFKPTAGRLSVEGIVPLAWSLDHAGPLARAVADVRLLFSVLDPTAGLGDEPSPDLPPTLGVLRGAFLGRAEVEASAQFGETTRRLADAGACLRDVELPAGFDLAVDLHHVIMRAEAAAYHAADHEREPDAYRPNLRAAIEVGSLVPATVYLQAQRVREELARETEPMFEGLDGLLMPSALGAAPASLSTTGDAVFNAPWSLFGVPALTVPSGLNNAGLPLGLQIIGPHFADGHLLQVGHWCEVALGPLPALSSVG